MNRVKGFSLVEAMMAIGLFALIGVSFYSYFSDSGKMGIAQVKKWENRVAGNSIGSILHSMNPEQLYALLSARVASEGDPNTYLSGTQGWYDLTDANSSWLLDWKNRLNALSVTVNFRLNEPNYPNDPTPLLTFPTNYHELDRFDRETEVVIRYQVHFDASETSEKVLRYYVPFGKSYWEVADGGSGTDGANYNPASNAQLSDLEVMDGNLYASWEEESVGVGQVRVARYNSGTNDWDFIEKVTPDQFGINYSTAVDAKNIGLTEANDQLFAHWIEGSPGQVRVSRLDPSVPSWSFVDTESPPSSGINVDPTKSAFSPNGVELSSRLYLSWVEDQKLRVKEFNAATTTWSLRDSGGLNFNLLQGVSGATLVSFNDKIYATWAEFPFPPQIRVKRYDPATTSWTFVERAVPTAEGVNFDPTHGGFWPHLHVHGGQLYLAWAEEGGSGEDRIRVARFNEATTTWTFIEKPTPDIDGIFLNGVATVPRLFSHANRLHLVWKDDEKMRVAYFDPNCTLWTIVEQSTEGLHKSAPDAPYPPAAVASFQGDYFLSFGERNFSPVRQILFFRGNAR